MAEKRRLFDVWYLAPNTVYKEVPYDVVLDWVQSGRLGSEDLLKASGTAQWLKIGSLPQFQAFAPAAEPARAEDTAESLEPVELGLQWKRRAEDDDDDVDMIPLIDVSLVLLIFFMLTTTVAAVSRVAVPEASNIPEISDNPEAVWIGMELDDRNFARFALSQGTIPPAAEDQGLSQRELLDRLDERLQSLTAPVEIRIAAAGSTDSNQVARLVRALEAKRQQGVQIRAIRAEVNQRTEATPENTP